MPIHLERMFSLKPKRQLLALLLSVMLLLPVGTLHADQQSTKIEVYYAPIHFVIDNQQMAPPEGQNGFIYNDNTYVPLRFIAYSLNKAVEWDAATYTVTLRDPSSQDKVIIADYNLNRIVRDSKIEAFDASQLAATELDVYFEKVTYVFDGQSKLPPEELPGLIYDNSLYVPLRFLSEAIGKKVDWDPATYTISAKAGASGEAATGSGEKPAEPGAGNKPDPAPSGQTGGTASPANPSGGTSGGNGGGGTGGGDGQGSQEPTYDELKAAADAKITALRDEAQSYYFGLLEQYKDADAETKKALKQEGANQLSVFDGRFANLMAEFEGQLGEHEYETDIISEYEQEYEQQKALAKALVEE